MLLQNKSAIYDYSFHKMLSNLKVQVQDGWFLLVIKLAIILIP